MSKYEVHAAGTEIQLWLLLPTLTYECRHTSRCEIQSASLVLLGAVVQSLNKQVPHVPDVAQHLA